MLLLGSYEEAQRTVIFKFSLTSPSVSPECHNAFLRSNPGPVLESTSWKEKNKISSVSHVPQRRKLLVKWKGWWERGTRLQHIYELPTWVTSFRYRQLAKLRKWYGKSTINTLNFNSSLNYKVFTQVRITLICIPFFAVALNGFTFQYTWSSCFHDMT